MSEPLYKRVLRGGASAAVGHEWELAQRIAELEAENAELQRAYEQERLDFREMKRLRERAEAALREVSGLPRFSMEVSYPSANQSTQVVHHVCKNGAWVRYDELRAILERYEVSP